MPRTSPFLIHLSSAEEAELHRRAGKYTLPYFQVQRAKMILLAAEGLSNDEIAARLDSRREVVGRWRKRFFTDRLQGLEERACGFRQWKYDLALAAPRRDPPVVSPQLDLSAGSPLCRKGGAAVGSLCP